MKALRYLLMVVAMVSFLSVRAQGLAQQPNTQMQSTSVMAGTGSTLPQAAQSGAVVTGNTPGTYSPASGRPGHIRRAASDEDEGDTPPADPQGPNEDPIGDAALPLALLALAYVGVRVLHKKRA